MAKALMRKDLTNKRFGKLVVKEIDKERTKDGKVYWICQCDCGNTTSVQSTSLTRKNGGTKSCGCRRNSKEALQKSKITSNSYPKNIEGLRFGKLTVLKKTDKVSERKSDNGSKLWECKCDCGNICYYSRYSLITPNGIKSCGCYYKETRDKCNKGYNKYNLSGEYGIGYCSNGQEFYFDLEDYDKIKNYCWNYDGRYVQTHLQRTDNNFNTKTIRLHRLILGINNREDINVDHINLIRYDCRKSNLRRANDCENSRNKIQTFATYDNPVGIRLEKDGKYSVRICKEYIGKFNNFEEAFKVRKKKEEEIFKEFQYSSSN